MKRIQALGFHPSFKKVFFLLLLSLSILKPIVPAESNDWNEMIDTFFRPLTYEHFDPTDFGKETTEKDKKLLNRFKPLISIAPEGARPIDFYEQYLPLVEIRKNSERYPATRKLLKSIERNNSYSLNFLGTYTNIHTQKSVAYGQVIREKVAFRLKNGGRRELPLTFLRYNFVFIKSGLPQELTWFKEFGSWIIGDPNLWHPLDIHGAIHVVLKEETPIAIILAQHNYHRTYLLKDIPFQGERVEISFAQRSNEPYPSPKGSNPTKHPAADTPEKIVFLLTGKKSGLKTGIDIVFGENSGGKKIDYNLKFLPDRDPLYTSWIPLGEKMKFLKIFNTWYRSAPPGMDLRTWPELKKYGELMQFWYVRDNNREDAEFMEENIIDFTTVNFEKILNRNGSRLFNSLKQAL